MVKSLGETGDWQLLAKSARGDEDAYGRLVMRHHDAAMAFTLQLVGDYQKAEDLVQRAFGNIFKGRERFVEKARFRTFLYRILTNLSLNQLARRRSATAFSALTADEDEPSVATRLGDVTSPDPRRALEMAEVDEMVTRALGTLRAEHRAALWLREHEGQSYKEIADTLNATLGEVKIWIHRARHKMLALLKPYLDEGSSPR